LRKTDKKYGVLYVGVELFYLVGSNFGFTYCICH